LKCRSRDRASGSVPTFVAGSDRQGGALVTEITGASAVAHTFIAAMAAVGGPTASSVQHEVPAIRPTERLLLAPKGAAGCVKLFSSTTKLPGQ